MVAIASVVGYLYLNGTFSSYSAGVTSCTTLEDVVSDLPSQYCSELVSLPFAPESVTAFNPSGDSITLLALYGLSLDGGCLVPELEAYSADHARFHL